MPRSKNKKKKKRKNRNCHCFAVNNCLRRCDTAVRFPTRFPVSPFADVTRSFVENCAVPFDFGLRSFPILIGWRNKNSVFRCQVIRRSRSIFVCFITSDDSNDFFEEIEIDTMTINW